DRVRGSLGRGTGPGSGLPRVPGADAGSLGARLRGGAAGAGAGTGLRIYRARDRLVLRPAPGSPSARVAAGPGAGGLHRPRRGPAWLRRSGWPASIAPARGGSPAARPVEITSLLRGHVPRRCRDRRVPTVPWRVSPGRTRGLAVFLAVRAEGSELSNGQARLRSAAHS